MAAQFALTFERGGLSNPVQNPETSAASFLGPGAVRNSGFGAVAPADIRGLGAIDSTTLARHCTDAPSVGGVSGATPVIPGYNGSFTYVINPSVLGAKGADFGDRGAAAGNWLACGAATDMVAAANLTPLLGIDVNLNDLSLQGSIQLTNGPDNFIFKWGGTSSAGLGGQNPFAGH